MPINRVTIVGNLTRDPELRGLPSGGSVCSLRVAVNERRKNGQTGEWEDHPNFFNVTVFGNSADATAKYLAKGRQVAVDGRLRWREYQDKDGNRREAIEIVAQDVQFIGGNPDGGGSQGGQQRGGYGGGGGSWDDNQGWSGGGQPQGGGGQAYTGPGSSYPVDGPDWSQQQAPPQQQGQQQWGQQQAPPPQQQQWDGPPPAQGPPAQPQGPPPTQAPPADDEIPF